MMVMSTAVICLFVLLVQVNAEQPQLVAGHVLFRHGDRTPIRTFPTDPYQQADWPNGFGQLTKIGTEQHYRLGQYLRRRYASLLSTTYVASEISVRSTDVDRTLMSAQSNLAGLYPALSPNASVPIQPVPIHTVPVDQDYLLGQNHCPRYEELRDEVGQNDEVKKINARYTSFFKKLEALTNLTNIQMQNVGKVFDTIYIDNIYNKAPAWADDDVQKTLSIIHNLAFYYRLLNTDSKRIRGGPLIKEILTNMENLSSGKASKKVKMYSAHDTTINAVLSFLGINYPHQPQYASALFIDLYKQGTTAFLVRVEYLNVTDSSTSFPYQLNGCSSLDCPLTNFSAIYTPLLPASADVECAIKMPLGGHGKIILVIVLIVVVLIAIMFTAFVCNNRQRVDEDAPLVPNAASTLSH